MGRIEKTVFISYRRTNGIWARAIYQDLTTHGYDVFYDFQSINSGDFSQIIVENIKARAHFLVLLTPSALERCYDPEDWLRLEIEAAIDTKRNIVPIILENFEFGSPDVARILNGKLSVLKNYNGLKVYSDYFEEGMARLRDRYLNIALDAVLHPISRAVEKATKEQQHEASKAEPVKQEELSAYEWFEKGWEAVELDEKIRYYSEAILLKPDYAIAFNNRGNALSEKGDLDRAIEDFTKSIEFNNPDLHSPYFNRGSTLVEKGNVDAAIKDYKEAIRIKPDYGLARQSLASILLKLGRRAEADEQIQVARALVKKQNEYNQACFEAIVGNVDDALHLLKIAIEKRPLRKQLAKRDIDFESIRDNPRFKELVGE